MQTYHVLKVRDLKVLQFFDLISTHVQTAMRVMQQVVLSAKVCNTFGGMCNVCVLILT